MDIEGMQLGDIDGGMQYSCNIERLVKGDNAVNKRRAVVFRNVLCSVSASRESVVNVDTFEMVQWTVTLRLRPGQELRRGDKILDIKDLRTRQSTHWDELNVIFIEYLDSFTYQATCNEGI